MSPKLQAHQWRVVVERGGRTVTRFYATLNEALAVANKLNRTYGNVAFVATPLQDVVPGTEPWSSE